MFKNEILPKWPYSVKCKNARKMLVKCKKFCIFGKYMLVPTKNIFTIFSYLLQIKSYSRSKKKIRGVTHLCPAFSYILDIQVFWRDLEIRLKTETSSNNSSPTCNTTSIQNAEAQILPSSRHMPTIVVNACDCMLPGQRAAYIYPDRIPESLRGFLKNNMIMR